jgi:eukaryotic-like serine/threonine-protein kinase
VLSSGHVLDNRYRLDERIATGGMGDVWRGTDVVLGRVVAVKVLKPAMLSDPEFAARFYGEARMMAAFRHPGVVEVYDYAGGGDGRDEDDCAYLVMAYVEGEPLSARLKEAGHLSVTETMSIVAQTAEALHAAHLHGTVHRDVKPGNLIVKPNGTVILVDFGVARSAQVTSMTGLNAIVGTALYMAPEQVAKGDVTPATDIYALGAVAYHCITGVPPFDGDNALQVALRHLEDEPEPLPPDVPEPVRALVTRAMAKHPADRFASAAEMGAAALEATRPLDWRALTGTAMTRPALTRTGLTSTNATRPITRAAPPPPAAAPAVPGAPGMPRSQKMVIAAIVLLFLTAGGLGLAIWLGGDRNEPSGNTPVTVPGATATATPGENPVDTPVTANPTRTAHPNGVPRPSTRPTTTSRAPVTSSPTPPPVKTTTPAAPPTTAPDTGGPTQGPTDDPTGGTGNGGSGAGDPGGAAAAGFTG